MDIVKRNIGHWTVGDYQYTNVKADVREPTDITKDEYDRSYTGIQKRLMEIKQLVKKRKKPVKNA